MDAYSQCANDVAVTSTFELSEPNKLQIRRIEIFVEEKWDTQAKLVRNYIFNVNRTIIN